MPLTIDLRQSDPIVGSIGDAVPCIDARKLDAADPAAREQVISTIRRACAETGFFYLEHAFADAATYRNVQQQMQRFFALPDSDARKQAVKARQNSGDFGWTPMFGEPSYQPGTVAHVESFDCGTADNTWPDLPDFQATVQNYWDTLTGVANSVLEVLAEAAGLERRFFADRCTSQDLSTLRLLHYPENDAPVSDSDVGISAHTDFECITFISQTAPGLELTDVDGNWYDAPSDDSRIVVLIDDMLERWTNGYYKATGHRVRNTNWSRYSVVMFFAVNDDELIAPLPRFVSESNLPRHSAITQREHIDSEVSRAVSNRDN